MLRNQSQPRIEKWNALSPEKQQALIKYVQSEATDEFLEMLDDMPTIYNTGFNYFMAKLTKNPTFRNLSRIIDWMIYIGKQDKLERIFERHDVPFLFVPTVRAISVDRQAKRIRLESKFTSR